ncbi:MAG: hypothetical protein JSV30_03370 [Candidatus Omnitrophota bacterium]|nr:MAG: hypothetical protein JSV30_03370 [Candidatus Omnitrophota bacterium]
MVIDNFPYNIDYALVELSSAYKIRLLKETYHDAINRELRWSGRNKLHRLDFTFIAKKSVVVVTYYLEKYPSFFSKILMWYNNYHPLFPFRPEVQWNKLSEFPIGLTKDEYKARIVQQIENVKKGMALFS